MSLMNIQQAKSTAQSIVKEIEGKIIKERLPKNNIMESDYLFEVEMHTEITHDLLDKIIVHLQNEKYIYINDKQWEKRIKESGSTYGIVVETRDRVFDILFSPNYKSTSVLNLRMSKIPSDKDLFAGNWF